MRILKMLWDDIVKFATIAFLSITVIVCGLIAILCHIVGKILISDVVSYPARRALGFALPKFGKRVGFDGASILKEAEETGQDEQPNEDSSQ
jgi:hypothetical protein